MYTDITEHCKRVIKRSSRTFAASFFADGVKYSDIKSIKISVPSASNGKISIGGTISNCIEIISAKTEIPDGKKITVYESVKLDTGEYEDVPMGDFKITSAVTKDCLTTITAEGPLSTETALGYFSKLNYPATTVQMLDEISDAIGIRIETDGLEELYVETKPEGYTHREVIGYLAGMHGKNAVETRKGTITLKWHEYCNDDIFTNKVDSPELSNSPFVIEKFECAVSGSATINRGEGFTGISISNPLMTEKAADVIWSKISGYKFRPGIFNIKSGTPCVDVWDSFTYNGEVVIATELEYTWDGGLSNVYKSVGERETSSADKGPTQLKLERYYAELVLIKDAMIDKLSVKEADIRYAQIEQLDVIAAEIEGAVIKNLEADIVTVEQLQATNARVLILETESLTAESALIQELKSGVADINTLIFGSATGTSIQTEFSNAVIAQLGDAMIKSAMIESLSAEKIAAGDIITNNVHVMSKDGRLIISDETMQISDEARVRVQIGKDGRGDYSISVWDDKGDLMFSKGGITDKAIKAAIIRDDMVSEDAAINASKLDIDSLFSEINGSTNTIKSTKVYFDSEGQTLDVAFQSMTTAVNGLRIEQSSQATEIRTMQGYISSKIWQQDIDAAVGAVEDDVSALQTRYSSFNQTLSEIKTTVGNQSSSISSLGVRVTNAESSITQQDVLLSTKVSQDGIISAINQSAEKVSIDASKIDLAGVVTFSTLDGAVRDAIESAELNATTAKSNASNALNSVSNSVKSVTLHYLATNLSSGVTTSTSGWTTTPQEITSSKKYLWTYQTVTSISGAKTTSTPVISGVYGDKGATGVGISNVVPLYYLKSNAIAPSTPTSAVTSASTSSGVWTTAVPTYVNGYTYFTCTQTLYTNGTYKWSAVVADNALTMANKNAYNANTAIANWCYSNDKTYIDGSKIYAGTVTAKQINVEDLFAQDITASGRITMGNAYITGGDIVLDADDGEVAKITINGPNGITSYIRPCGFYASESNGNYSAELDITDIGAYLGVVNMDYVWEVSHGIMSYTKGNMYSTFSPTSIYTNGKIEGASVKTTTGADLDTINKNLNNALYASNINGYYYKLYDGTLICAKTVTVTATVATAWGSLYESASRINFGNWPYTFIAVPNVSITNVCATAGFAEDLTGLSTTAVGSAYICRASTVTNGTFKFSIIGIGRWK